MNLTDQLICPKCREHCHDTENSIEENIIIGEILTRAECDCCGHRFYIEVVGLTANIK